MMDSFAKEIVRELDARFDDMSRIITLGIKDRDEYWRCVGFLQGLEAIRAYVMDLAQRAERDDDN